MKKLILATTTAIAAFATQAYAEPSCKPAAAPKPMWEAVKGFEESGGKVVQVKINAGGCYEIYGQLSGKKFEIFFDPATGNEINRIQG